MTAFDISRDEKRIVFSMFGENGTARIWLASLDHRFAPRQVASLDGYSPRFAPDGTIVFRGQERGLSFAYRIGQDGSGLQRVVPDPISFIHSVSPDGQWVIVHAPSEDQPARVSAYPIRGGSSKMICSAWCAAQWTAGGRFLYVTLESTTHGRGWKTFVIPLSPGKLVPELPSAGIESEADLSRLPIAQVIERRYLSPGPDPSVYAFNEGTVNRNLYRVPLP
jgi:hypothetical protein